MLVPAGFAACMVVLGVMWWLTGRTSFPPRLCQAVREICIVALIILIFVSAGMIPGR
jgi:hypothetical protein